MNIVLILPILVPLVTAILSVSFGTETGWPMASPSAGRFSTWRPLPAAGYGAGNQGHRLWIGGWPAPFGICLVADYLSA
jgi:multicomponent Na+:H+ antiporter subunit D